MKMELLCSTGTLVGRANGFNHKLVVRHHKNIEADGFELMMLKAFYEKLAEVARDLTGAGVKIRTIHFEKDITALLGLHGEEEIKEGLRLFALNAEMGKNVGAEKAVFHLWDGRFSAVQTARVISLLEALYEICEKNGLALVVENVPAREPSPYENVEEIARRYPGSRFTFDTRHCHFMKQIDTFFESNLWHDRIGHIHVSDYSGETVPEMWGVTRPILHPGEGIIDFEALFAKMPPCVADTLTLESPVIGADGAVDIEKLNLTLRYLSRLLKKS
jgi:sugar phosphate isomerase/epimerase